MTLRRTSDHLPKKRYGGGMVEFDRGVRTTNDYDAETEEWAAETFDELEVDGAESDGTEDEAARAVSELDDESEE